MYIKVKSEIYEVEPTKKALREGEKHGYLADGSELLVESPKSHGSRQRTSEKKNIIAAYIHALQPGRDKRKYDKYKKRWKRKKKRLGKELKIIGAKLANGEISKNQFLSKAHKLFKDGYESAYRLGTYASGLDFIDLPETDKRWLKRARKYEYKFLRKFADVLAAKAEEKNEALQEDWSPADANRMMMYVNTMDSMFDAGRVDAYPDESTKVYWETNPAEHCDDCLDLEDGSPYTPDTLPTTPRAGDTQCLSNCKCNLRLRYKKPDKIELIRKPIPYDQAKKLGLLKVVSYSSMVALYKKHFGEVPDEMKEPEDEEEQEEAYVPEKEKLMDWDILDNTVSSLTRLKLNRKRYRDRPGFLLNETRKVMDEYEKSMQRLPDWVSSLRLPELMVMHKLGGVLLAEKGG